MSTFRNFDFTTAKIKFKDLYEKLLCKLSKMNYQWNFEKNTFLKVYSDSPRKHPVFFVELNVLHILEQKMINDSLLESDYFQKYIMQNFW